TDSSSRWINSILRPPRSPPLALISSMARLRPRVMASPDWAEPPESAATWPILMGSSADEDVVAAPTTASVSLPPNPIATPSLRHREYAFFIAPPNVSSSTRQHLRRNRSLPALGPKSGFAAGAQLKAKPLDMRLGGNALLLSKTPSIHA